jgi:CheY-like chemotaxis protein
MAATILIIDDSPAHRRIMRVFLSGQAYRFLEADTGKRALELLRAEHVDLVIVDLRMPEMDGVTCIREIRSSRRPELRRMPIVVLTGVQSADDEEALAAGADSFLRKPVSSADVQQVVTKLLTSRS